MRRRPRDMDLYSRMVALFKVLLPLAALGILATLFLISRGIEFDAQIPFAESEVAERVDTQQITAPFFSGTTPGGDEITVTARLARPGSHGAPAEAEAVHARMVRASGDEMTLDADTARIDIEEDMATFSGEVKVQTSGGLRLETEVLKTALHGTSGNAPGQVTGTGPFGSLDAGQMEFGPKSEGEPVQFLFKQGVKLVYQPKRTED